MGRRWFVDLKTFGEKLSGTQGTGDILCPFFSAHNAVAIRCRDIYPGTTSVTMNFKNAEEKRFQLETYCQACYKKCWLYASAMDLMWGEENED